MKAWHLAAMLVVSVAIHGAAGRHADASEMPPKASAEPAVILRGALVGVRQRISFFYEVNPDCTSEGIPTIHTLSAPQHGTLEAKAGEGYPSFSSGSQSVDCNLHKSPGTLLYYTGAPGFQGDDAATVSVIYPDGYRYVVRFQITVESPG